MKTIDKIEKIILYTLKTICLIILLLTFSYIPLLIFKIDLSKISLTNKIIYLTISDIILLIIYLLIYKKTIKKDFKNFFNKDILNNIKTPLKYWIIGLIIMITSNYIIISLTNITITQNEQAVRTLIEKSLPFMIFESIIYAPITEEIIFRKSIKDIIENKYIYIIISGFIFGFMHIIRSTTNYKELLFIIPYGAVGAMFALTYHKTNNIFSTIFIHSLHNSLTLIIYLLSKTI